MDNIFGLSKLIKYKNIQYLVNTNKINKYEEECLFTMFDLKNYSTIHHYDEYIPDTEIVDSVILTKCGYGFEPPVDYKRTGMAISYGIIVFYWDQNEQKEYYLITQRRDSIPYADFVRGKYKLEYLPRYFSLMTKNEREIIKNYTFDDIWDDLNIVTNSEIKNENRARRAWYRLQKQNIIDQLLNTTESYIDEPEWEFPKGRKLRDESAVACAMREFEEESKIDQSKLYILNRKTPFLDTFYGSNDKLYQTIYYPALMKQKYVPDVQCIDNIIRHNFVSSEIAQVKWVDFDELKYYVNARKYKLIKEQFRPWILENITDNGFMRTGVKRTGLYRTTL